LLSFIFTPLFILLPGGNIIVTKGRKIIPQARRKDKKWRFTPLQIYTYQPLTKPINLWKSSEKAGQTICLE
jgi:hypothetical protein